jgi:hypothetical protein
MVGVWSWRSGVEGQAGLAEEGVGEVGLVLHAFEFGLDGGGELVDGAGDAGWPGGV